NHGIFMTPGRDEEWTLSVAHTDAHLTRYLEAFEAFARDVTWEGTWLIACSASAVIVRLGLTPTLAGTAAPSQTSSSSQPTPRWRASTTPRDGSAPITAPPRMCAVVGMFANASITELCATPPV